MSATGLEVFDKTIHTTNVWLDEIMSEIGPDRHVAWHVLGSVLRAVRDRIPIELAAHLGSQLPIIVRGTYYDRFQPAREPLRIRSEEEFLELVQQDLGNIRPVNPRAALTSVFDVLSRHVTRGQCEKVRAALPSDIQQLWNLEKIEQEPDEEAAERGRAAQNAQDAQLHRSPTEHPRPRP